MLILNSKFLVDITSAFLVVVLTFALEFCRFLIVGRWLFVSMSEPFFPVFELFSSFRYVFFVMFLFFYVCD